MFNKKKILKSNNDLLMKQNSELRAANVEYQKQNNVLEADNIELATMISKKDEEIKELKKEVKNLKRKLTIATKEK